MIIRARTVVTMDGPPVENGAVAVSVDRIVGVGKFDQIKKENSGEIIDLGEQALLPGLINAHCHLDYTCLRGRIPPQRSFADWIRAINAEKAKLSRQDYVASMNQGFAEATAFGTTTIANLTAFPELIAEINAPIRTWWFAELIDVRAPERANETVGSATELLRSSLERADMSAPATGRTRRGELSKRSRNGGIAAVQMQQWGLAPHALFTASKELYERCEHISQREQVLLTTHLAESREEMEMFRDASGALYEFMKGIGRPMDDCGQATALAQFLKIRDSSTPRAFGARNDNEWIVAHLNELTDSDFKLLENCNTQFDVVHCPRSHDYFGHGRFAFERLRALGFNICLGTDSLASNQSLSLFDEMRSFQKKFSSVSPEKILQMVTVNPARALRQKSTLGQIIRGARADLLAAPFRSDDVLEEIIAFTDEPWMMIDGEVQ